MAPGRWRGVQFKSGMLAGLPLGLDSDRRVAKGGNEGSHPRSTTRCVPWFADAAESGHYFAPPPGPVLDLPMRLYEWHPKQVGDGRRLYRRVQAHCTKYGFSRGRVRMAPPLSTRGAFLCPARGQVMPAWRSNLRFVPLVPPGARAARCGPEGGGVSLHLALINLLARRRSPVAQPRFASQWVRCQYPSTFGCRYVVRGGGAAGR